LRNKKKAETGLLLSRIWASRRKT